MTPFTLDDNKAISAINQIWTDMDTANRTRRKSSRYHRIPVVGSSRRLDSKQEVFSKSSL